MMKNQKTIAQLTYLEDDIAEKILPIFKEIISHNPKTVFLFHGQLGAGKTTLIRQILQHLFGISKVTSPTFAYLNQYDCKELSINHFDLYRLNSFEEFLAQGFNDEITQNLGPSFIEWPEVAMEFFLSISDQPVYIINLKHLFVNGVNLREFVLTTR